MLREAGTMTLLGIGLGVAGALRAHAIDDDACCSASAPANPLVYLSMSLLLAVVALIAVAVPSSRATRDRSALGAARFVAVRAPEAQDALARGCP